MYCWARFFCISLGYTSTSLECRWNCAFFLIGLTPHLKRSSNCNASRNESGRFPLYFFGEGGERKGAPTCGSLAYWSGLSSDPFFSIGLFPDRRLGLHPLRNFLSPAQFFLREKAFCQGLNRIAEFFQRRIDRPARVQVNSGVSHDVQRVFGITRFQEAQIRVEFLFVAAQDIF